MEGTKSTSTPLAALSNIPGVLLHAGVPLDRRYRIARRLASQGRVALPNQFDLPTRELADYLRFERESVEEGQRLALARRHPDIAGALEIYRDASRTRALWVEALVLAREPLKAIAVAAALTEEVVERYRSFFFSFGGRINDQIYVLDAAIRPEFERSADRAAATLRALTMLVAYRGGRAALDALPWIGRLSAGELCVEPSRLAQELAVLPDLQALMQDFFAAPRDLPVDPQRREAWLASLLTKLDASFVAKKPPGRSPVALPRVPGQPR